MVRWSCSRLATCQLFPDLSLSLSHTEHGWAHGSNTVYSIIHGLTGTSIELQPCLGRSWYDLDSNVARVCTNKAWIYSIKQGFHGLNTICKTIFIRFLYGSKYGLLRPSTIKHDFYPINWTFTGFTYGPTDFCSSNARIITYSYMFWYKIDYFWWLGFTKFRTFNRERKKWHVTMFNSYLNRIGRMAIVWNRIGRMAIV